MSNYWLGEVVHLTFEVDISHVDVDPSTLSLLVIKPDLTTSTVDPTHDPDFDPDTGHFACDYPPPVAGLGYRWVATSTGTGQAVASGGFDVYDPAATEPPLVGVVQPWTDAAAVRGRPGCVGLDQKLLDDATRAASEILYALSGRQFSGRRAVTVRPTAAREGGDRPAGLWSASWGCCPYSYASGYGTVALAVWSGHACRCAPPQIELGAYPVTAITAVKINGTEIPATEYRVDDHRWLVRVKATAASAGTEMDGWPTCQRLDLPDTEDATFSVAFVHGTPPPAAGVFAATVLAAELALAGAPDGDGVEARLPERVRSIVRQGESITLIDPQDVLEQGRTGIPEVDLFLKSVNPSGSARRSAVWSPDLGRTRRTTWSSA